MANSITFRYNIYGYPVVFVSTVFFHSFRKLDVFVTYLSFIRYNRYSLARLEISLQNRSYTYIFRLRFGRSVANRYLHIYIYIRDILAWEEFSKATRHTHTSHRRYRVEYRFARLRIIRILHDYLSQYCAYGINKNCWFKTCQ